MKRFRYRMASIAASAAACLLRLMVLPALKTQTFREEAKEAIADCLALSKLTREVARWRAKGAR